MSDSEIEIDGQIYVKKSFMEDEIGSGDRRRALLALRDYLVHELSGHRCERCEMSQLKTGDTAALVLRLQKILEDIDEIPVADTGPIKGVAKITDARSAQNAALRAELENKKAAAGSRRENPPRRSNGRRS